MNSRQTVLLTGASGSMGFETFQEIWKNPDVNLVLLLRKSSKNIKKFQPYFQEIGLQIRNEEKISERARLKIIWGDATHFENISLAVKGVDWVFNCMAIIPPKSEQDTRQTEQVNVKAVELLIHAIKQEPDGAKRIKFVNIGSISEYGDRNGQIRKVRVGDPVIINPFDVYGLSKYRAEKLVVESGLQYWVQLRLTFIVIPDLFSLKDPIMFHQPLNCWIECITAKDAGYGLAQCLKIDDQSDFWRRVYNMGGGYSCQIDYHTLLKRMFGMVGMRLEKILEPSWFAIRNQHIAICEDSHILNDYLHYQHDSFDDYVQLVWEKLSWYLKTISKLNTKIAVFRWLSEKITRVQLKKMALSKSGTLHWIYSKNELRVKAFWGSYEKQKKALNWAALNNSTIPSEIRLYHGFDEQKEQLDISDLQQAAQYRGWSLLTKEWDGNMYQQLEWQCSFFHHFTATPYSILRAGHGCPNCDPPDWNYDEISKHNAFIAQVWYQSHDNDEVNVYPKNCY